MKRKKITLPIVLILLGVVYYFSFTYIYTQAVNQLLSQQVETSKNQANLIANFLAEQIATGKELEKVKQELQASIENTSTENSFVCMFDDSGVEVCHPNKEKIGKVLDKNNSVIKNIENQKIIQNFKESILKKQEIGGLRKLKNYTEIVYLSPVKNTNWIVASHANVEKFKANFKNLKEKLIFLFVSIWLISSLLLFFFLQQIHTQNLEKLRDLNQNTASKYLTDLDLIYKKINIQNKTENQKINRLLADRGSLLTPVYIDNIAFIYTENKITYLVEFDNKKATINTPLEELFTNLDNKLFYRASRQVIVSAKAIEKIEKYGATQLKVYTTPNAPIPIIISKAKLTDFKKWIGQK